MILICRYCAIKMDDISYMIKHLKLIHYIAENGEPIKCCVNRKNDICNKSYVTFNGLRTHMKSCVLKVCVAL
jgi:hypothetical protein